ncbi:hypothetical protein NPIL_10531 [Nephila pilipes]|uniref:Uncharacterized protein n=1 Tax=Nephila pilipes TaxID=299642 RepID=A0A8X6TX90_NEPPI|nr:hypothetical protein NPIL_10531 [Nephila pilipes]
MASGIKNRCSYRPNGETNESLIQTGLIQYPQDVPHGFIRHSNQIIGEATHLFLWRDYLVAVLPVQATIHYHSLKLLLSHKACLVTEIVSPVCRSVEFRSSVSSP